MCTVTEVIELACHALQNSRSLVCEARLVGHASRKESSVLPPEKITRVTGYTKGCELRGKNH